VFSFGLRKKFKFTKCFFVGFGYYICPVALKLNFKLCFEPRVFKFMYFNFLTGFTEKNKNTNIADIVYSAMRKLPQQQQYQHMQLHPQQQLQMLKKQQLIEQHQFQFEQQQMTATTGQAGNAAAMAAGLGDTATNKNQVWQKRPQPPTTGSAGGGHGGPQQPQPKQAKFPQTQYTQTQVC